MQVGYPRNIGFFSPCILGQLDQFLYQGQFWFSTFVCICGCICSLFLICYLISCKFWNRLLDPKLESSGSLFVGSCILQLILHLPSQIVVHIRDLIAALVKHMQSAQNFVLLSSLLIVFARLAISPTFQINLNDSTISFWW